MPRNIAKCRLCDDVIESKHLHDYVKCSCESIAILGGEDHWYAFSRDAKNLIRIDEETSCQSANVKPQNNSDQNVDNDQGSFTKAELLDMLDSLAKSIERLPTGARLAPITHADHHDLITLLSSILRAS